MKIPIVIQFTNLRNCLAKSSDALTKQASHSNGVLTARVTTDNAVAYFSLDSYSSNAKPKDSNTLRISGLYGIKLDMKNNCTALLEVLENVPACVCAWIEPCSVDDWEILELHAGTVEAKLLDQLRVVWPGQTFPLWVDENICIYLRTVKTEPSAECCILIPLSELFVEPKVLRSGVIPPNSASETSTSSPEVDHKQHGIGNVKPVGLLRKIVRYKLLKKMISIVKFLCFYLWRDFLPGMLRNVYLSLYPIPKDAIKENKSVLGRREKLMYNINNLPDECDIIIRVEPVITNKNLHSSERFLFDQPSTVFFHTRSHISQNNAVLHLAMLSKMLSPTEKLQEKKVLPQNPSNLQNKNSETNSCVVRIYIHPLSKYAMKCNWDVVYHAQSIRITSPLRRQLNIGVTSKVRIRKLTALPNLCDNVESITLRIISGLPSDIFEYSDLISSFDRWMSGICDEDNPLPIAIGSLLVFPLHREAEEIFENCDDILEVVVAGIECSNPIVTKSSIINNTFLINSNDLNRVKINFVEANQPNEVPSLSEINIKLPITTFAVNCQGLNTEYESIVQFIQQSLGSRPLANALIKNGCGLKPNCVLVTGNKGVGKSTLCMSVLNQFGSDSNLHAYVDHVHCGQFKGKKPENIAKHFERILSESLWRQPSIILLDDLDHLLPMVSTDEERSPDAMYVLQILSVIKHFFKKLAGRNGDAWETSQRVSIIVTARSKSSLHTCFVNSKSYFYSKHVHIDLPNRANRAIMLQSITQNFTNYQWPSDNEDILNKTEGFAASDLVSVMRRSSHFVQKRVLEAKLNNSADINLNLQTSDIISSMEGFTPTSLMNTKLHKPSPLTWKHVGGLSAVKDKLVEQLVWPIKYSHVFKDCGLEAQSGVLLFGPPGCGKTLIAGVVANECKLNFISIKGPELLSKYIGASEAAVRDVFSRAKSAAPCVLFFDEFDSLAPPRGHDSTGVTDRVVNQLLTHLDGVEPLVGVTVMAASSRPDLLDPALLRPGRLDNLLYCPMPNEQERYEILLALTANLPISPNVDLRAISRSCENFSGADLKALLYNAQLESINNLHLSNPPEASFSMGSSSTISPQLEFDDELLDIDSYDHEQLLQRAPNFDEETTAEELIKKVNKLKQQQKKDYKICYGASQNSSSADVVSLDPEYLPITPPSIDQYVTYYPTISEGLSEIIPEDVIKSTEIICQSYYQSDKLLIENEVKPATRDAIKIENCHLQSSLDSTQPSLTKKERVKLENLYSGFTRWRDPNIEQNYYAGKQRATLS